MDRPKRYESIKHAVTATSFFLDVLILASLILTGWSARIRDFAASTSDSSWIVVLVYVAIVGAILKIAELPLSFFSGYIVEHRFGLSRESFAGWATDQLKAAFLGGLLAIFGVEVLYYVLRTYPEQWWFLAASGFVLFFVIMTNVAPVLLLPLFFKFRPIENEDLNRRVQRLAQRTGTPVCGIFEWSLGEKTRKANAAVVGWGNTRRIIVSDTLLQNFSGEEIEVIMAHELCHHAKNHIWLAMMLQGALTFVAFYAVDRLLVPLSVRFGLGQVSDVANFPLFVLIVSGVSLIVLPAINYFSRHLEKAADLYALDVTGDSLAFVSSMEKLAELNLADKAPNKIIEFIFYSHPSIENRIKLAADHVGQIV
ncbi:MAG: M48 family metallopeptidase [Acidobacteria bacterium]|nr:M48 family metallopeptidase [Acidobacteriota bacterium]